MGGRTTPCKLVKKNDTTCKRFQKHVCTKVKEVHIYIFILPSKHSIHIQTEKFYDGLKK